MAPYFFVFAAATMFALNPINISKGLENILWILVIIIGTLFLFFNCSSRIPSAWVLRDIQSLDTKIMNTKQWLKSEKSNYKYLNKVMRNELSFYRKNDFRVFQDLDREMELLNKCLDKVKSSLNKQVKLATKIKKRPSLGVFDGKQIQKKKKSLF